MGGWIAVGVRELEGLENNEDWGGWKPVFNPPSTFIHFTSNRPRQVGRVKFVRVKSSASNCLVPVYIRPE